MPTAVSNAPTYTGYVNQDFVVEALQGPFEVMYYLKRFPDALYRKTPDARLFKMMQVLLGPDGVGWILKEYLKERIALEEQNVDLFDLDAFYGNPFAFSRILDEEIHFDTTGLIDPAQWQFIKDQNASYRSRALNFISGARAGNTPEGMQLVAQSGLGHACEIIENYKYLYDTHSDDPLGYIKLGKTNDLEEMIILPRRTDAEAITTINDDGNIVPDPTAIIEDKDLYTLQSAIDRIRAQTTILTVGTAPGTRRSVGYEDSWASSENREVVRYVTGNSKVTWPSRATQPWWIEANKEHAGNRLVDLVPHDYQGWHAISKTTASSAWLTTSDSDVQTTCSAPYSEPILSTGSTILPNGKPITVINDIYPLSYSILPGVPNIKYQEKAWLSSDRDGTEYLTLDLATFKACNHISLEVIKTPCTMTVAYAADPFSADNWILTDAQQSVTMGVFNEFRPQKPDPQNPNWLNIGLDFTNIKGQMIYARFLRVFFTRPETTTHSIVGVKNLRVGRIVS